jgi:hypothetical protein
MSGQLEAYVVARVTDPSTLEKKVTCIDVFDKTVFVGSSTGKVSIFKVEPREGTLHVEIGLSKNVSGKRAIEQIVYLPGAKKLVIRAESKVMPFDKDTLTRLWKPAGAIARGCDWISGAKDEEASTIVVITKKKVSIVEILEDRWEFRQEISVVDQVLTALLYKNVIYMGSKKHYRFCDLSKMLVQDADVPVEGVQPLMELVNDKEILFATNYPLGVFLNLQCKPAQRGTIPWPEHPVSIRKGDSFLLALLSNNVIEVWSLVEDHTKIQTLKCNLGQFLVGDPRGTGLSFIGSEDSIDCLLETSLEHQIDQYLKRHLFDRALALLHSKEVSAESVRMTHIKIAHILIQSLRFNDAVKHLNYSQIDPREFILRFPEFCIDSTLLYRKEVGRPKSAPSSDIAVVIREGKDYIDRFLASNDQKDPLMQETVSKLKSLRDYSVDALELNAHLALARFLWTWRASNVDKFASVQKHSFALLEAVDTALLMVHSSLSQKLAGRSDLRSVRSRLDGEESSIPFALKDLLFPTNFCLLEKSEVYLTSRQRYSALALLYQSKNEIRKSLIALQNLGAGTWVDGDDDGFEETINILRRLDDGPLLWEFIEWVMVKDFERALEVFTLPERKTELALDKTLYRLEQLENKIRKNPSVKDPDDCMIVVAYLEFLVFTANSKESIAHNKLATWYINSYKKIKDSDNTKVIRSLRDRFCFFLSGSSSIDGFTLIPLLQELQLWEELSIVYAQLRYDKEMLDLCIYTLNDHSRAWRYCADAGRHPNDPGITPDRISMALHLEKSAEVSSLFISLLKMYTSPNMKRLP